MSTKLGVAVLALLAATACSHSPAGTLPATQQLTRRVSADPAHVVAATLSTFGKYGIPVRESNATKGEVQSVPLDLRSNWGATPTQDRLNCPGGPDTTAAHVTFHAKAEPADGGTLLTLNADREGGGRCVLRSSFVTQLLDSIVTASQSS